MLNAPVVNTYPISNYKFFSKDPIEEKETSLSDRISRMKLNYEKEGMRRSVEGVLLVQEHKFPHVLLLEDGDACYKLFGGKLRPGENEIEGLRRKLTSKIGLNQPQHQLNWQIKECLGMWWRPHFDTLMYPYCPVHVTKPKECKKIYLVQLPERGVFAVPENFKLIAVPLFELYDNFTRYGPVISSIPQQVSSFRFQYITPEDKPPC